MTLRPPSSGSSKEADFFLKVRGVANNRHFLW